MKRRKVFSLMIIIMLIMISAPAALAQQVAVPANMQVQPVAIDFEITESISMYAESGQNQLTIDNLQISNNAENGYKLIVSEIAVTAAEEWILKPDTEDFSAKIDQNEFSLTTGGHDFYTGSVFPADKIIPGNTKSYGFSGQTGIFTTAVSEKAADFIVTIDYEKVNLINFSVDGTSYTAAEGMTWQQWVSSPYNTDGFKIVSGAVLGTFWVGNPEAYTKEEASAINFAVEVKPADMIIAGTSYHTNCCFVAGTMVQTSLGGDVKPIEQLGKGDMIVSYNVDTEEFYLAEVQSLITHPDTTDMAEVIFAGGEKLVMNAYHPILTDEGFKSLTNFGGFPALETGDMARTAEGFSEVKEIIRYEGQPIDTYTLAVKDPDESPDVDSNDTYIANGIVVHNVSCWYTWY